MESKTNDNPIAMKIKILILSFLFSLNSFGQKLPITNLCLSDIVAVTGGTCLSDAFTNANSSYFDATYAIAGANWMSEFRNYGPSGASAPTVTTTAITSITSTTATSGGNVTSDGGASVTARGVCWNTSTNPTTANSHTSDGTGTGSYSSLLTSLTDCSTYYVRAYATNSVGTSYGSNVVFTTTTITTHGKLYNQYTLINIANTGWHAPSGAEYTALVTYLGGATVAGGHLKETGTVNWHSPNVGADNSSGFSGLGSGTRGSDTDGFMDIGTRNYLWETDLYTGPLTLTVDNTAVRFGSYMFPWVGCSVRLIKDDSILDVYIGNDGKTYSTVKIGSQVWMSQNLKETKYRDGTSIPEVTSGWEHLTTGAFCWYNNDSSYE